MIRMATDIGGAGNAEGPVDDDSRDDVALDDDGDGDVDDDDDNVDDRCGCVALPVLVIVAVVA